MPGEQRGQRLDRWLAAEKAKLQAEGWSLPEPLDPEAASGVDVWLKVRVKGRRPTEVPDGA